MEKQVNTILLVGASWRAFDDASTTSNILALTIYRTVKQKNVCSYSDLGKNFFSIPFEKSSIKLDTIGRCQWHCSIATRLLRRG